MIIDKYKKEGKDIPKLLREYDIDKTSNLDDEIEAYKLHWELDNNLTEEFETKLREYIK